MPEIQLPDESKRQYNNPVTGLEIAASIGKALARDAVAVSVDGELWDLTRAIDRNAAVKIVTRGSEDGLGTDTWPEYLEESEEAGAAEEEKVSA